MARALRPWQNRTLSFFEKEAEKTQRVFTREQLGSIMAAYSSEFQMPATLSLHRFIEFLETAGDLKKVAILSEANLRRASDDAGSPRERAHRYKPAEDPPTSYRPFTRYIWGAASAYEVALSLRGGSYLSHASAVFLHGMTTQITRAVYANKEQTPKPSAKGSLTQDGIDLAFSRRSRTSQFIYVYEGTRIVLLSGKNTNNLEVSEIPGPASIPVTATKLERTLIDITVRPAYAGGVFEVLDAYRGARERASVATLLATLKKLQYVYPYHQAIGFYMDRAGYLEGQLERVRKIGLKYDFYLTYQIPQPLYDQTWRIYYPAGL